MIVIIYLFQWRSQDSQHVHKRKLNEKKFVLSAIAFERAVERDYFIFPVNISEYCIAAILLLFIKSSSTDPNVLWFCFNSSKRRNIFRENFFKIGNSRRNIKLLVTGYVINYLTADCHMPNRKEGKWPRDFTTLGKNPGGGYCTNFWVGMCRWDPGTLNLYQS